MSTLTIQIPGLGLVPLEVSLGTPWVLECEDGTYVRSQFSTHCLIASISVQRSVDNFHLSYITDTCTPWRLRTILKNNTPIWPDATLTFRAQYQHKPAPAPTNNDGRTTCYACGAPTKTVAAITSSYQVCTSCGL